MSESNLPARMPKSRFNNLPIVKLFKRARRGDASALPELRRIMDHPRGQKYFRDLAGQVRAALVDRFAKDDLLVREIMLREMKTLRAELLGPAPSAIERLLVERVAIGWLEVQTAEYQLAVREAAVHAYWQEQVDHANRRFLAALRMLTAVRRLPRSAIQVNIADQQVNVSG